MGNTGFYIWAALLPVKMAFRPSRLALANCRQSSGSQTTSWTRSGLAMLKVPGVEATTSGSISEFGQVPGIHIFLKRCSKVNESQEP